MLILKVLVNAAGWEYPLTRSNVYKVHFRAREMAYVKNIRADSFAFYGENELRIVVRKEGEFSNSFDRRIFKYFEN